MRRLFLGGIALAVGVVSTAALALTDDPITTRKKLMQGNGAVFYGVAQGMIKGEIPFNPVLAASVLRTTNAVAYSFGDYFPAGSEEGGDTRASPEIWENMAEFQQYLAEFRAATDAAREADPQTLEAFQAAIDEINRNCQQCHDDFRIERN